MSFLNKCCSFLLWILAHLYNWLKSYLHEKFYFFQMRYCCFRTVTVRNEIHSSFSTTRWRLPDLSTDALLQSTQPDRKCWKRVAWWVSWGLCLFFPPNLTWGMHFSEPSEYVLLASSSGAWSYQAFSCKGICPQIKPDQV